MKIKNLLPLIILFLLFDSCQITNRRYMSGWYIETFSNPKREMVRIKTENSFQKTTDKSLPVFASLADSISGITINKLYTSSLVAEQKTHKAIDKEEEKKYLKHLLFQKK